MQQDKRNAGRLVIHTAQTEKGGTEDAIGQAPQSAMRHRFPRLPGRRRAHHSSIVRRRRTPERTGEDTRLTAGERLMRNTAIACALLLTIMALKNLNQPWSQQATEGIRQAMTMRLDLDETLGRLQFVRALIPETALVFFNLDADEGTALTMPVSGTLTHAYDEQQPWLQYECTPAQPVYAAAAGTVATVGQGAQGDYIVSINHENDMQTVYAYLKQVSVAAGDEVEAGAQLGMTGDQQPSSLYFELREAGQSADPSNRLRESGQ